MTRNICSRNDPLRILDNYTRLVKRQMLSRIIGENLDLPRRNMRRNMRGKARYLQDIFKANGSLDLQQK